MNWKIKFYIWRTRARLITWWRNHQLVWCARCGKTMFVKSARFERTTTGQEGALCEKCHKELYQPFEGGQA